LWDYLFANGSLERVHAYLLPYKNPDGGWGHGRILDYLEESQREDGGWGDEHGLTYWHPYFSTIILLAL